MKILKNIIISIILGLITTAITFYFTVDKGDFTFSGLPLPYYNGVWGMGMNYYTDWVYFILDLLIWSATWFIVIKLISWIKRKFSKQQ